MLKNLFTPLVFIREFEKVQKVGIETKLVVCCLFLSSCISLPPTVDRDNTKQSELINNYLYHVQTYGDQNNPVIVVIHGGPGGDSNYLTTLKDLSDSFYVVFYDQRGTGLSPRVDAHQLTVESSLSDLDNIVEHYRNNKKVILLGHSWGAMLAVGYLEKNRHKVSHVIAGEPGMLHPEAAKDFVKKTEAHQSIWDALYMVGQFFVIPFVKSEDGHERTDYVMTQILNRNKPGPPYQCEGESLDEEYFTRGGFESFNNMLRPVFNRPEEFTYDLSVGAKDFEGQVLFISSECSVIGYEFQQRHHLPLMPKGTKHILAKKMGHNFVTTHPKWTIESIREFLSEREN